MLNDPKFGELVEGERRKRDQNEDLELLEHIRQALYHTNHMESTHKPDYQLLLYTGILLVIGLIMITSIGVPKSIQISAPGVLYPSCDDATVDCYLLFKRHLIRMMIGIAAMFVVAKINYKLWEKISIWLFGLSILLLIVVLILGSSNNTFATSWLNIFNTSIQPTEFAKIALVFYLAHWFEKRRADVGNFQYGFIPFCVITGGFLLPILAQPDLGSSFVISAVAVGIYFAAGAKMRHIAVGFAAVAVISMLILLSTDHVRERFKAFVSTSAECREDYCWQTEQAQIAVGSGGFLGKGLAQGVQKSYWLPQASDDFIFAASAEELGFVRTALLVLLYGMIAYRGFMIAEGAPSGFAQLTAIGITVWITFQAFINIGVNINLFPVTGITLPFVSYGGSSLIASLIGIGILLNISKYSSHASGFHRRRNSGARPAQYRRY